jgi:hypothetical protein
MDKVLYSKTAFYPAFDGARPTLETHYTDPEPAVNVFVYIGTPSDNIGNNGDFYLEEETNLLYGPKANGAWPEDGVPVSGPVMRHKKRIRQKAWSSQPVARPTITVRLQILILSVWKACRKRLLRN